MAQSDMLSADEARARVERLENEKARKKAAEQAGEERVETAASFVVTRLATRVATKFVPKLEPLTPVLSTGGAGYGLFKAFDADTDKPGRYMGAGLAFSVDVIDMVADFAFDTVSKFKNKTK